MTQGEYLQLVQKSHAFKKMPVDLQKSVMGATGELMLKYADIFLDEQKMIVHAQENFLAKNKEISGKLTVNIKKIKKDWLVKKEDASNKQDALEEERLLTQINNL